MRCAIFSCLMAFCVIQIVHGVMQEEACETYITQFHDYLTKMQEEFYAAKCKSKKSEEAIDECFNDFNAQLKDEVPKVEDDLGGCTNIKTPRVVAQIDKNCCKNAYKSFKDWMDKLMKEKLACL